MDETVDSPTLKKSTKRLPIGRIALVVAAVALLLLALRAAGPHLEGFAQSFALWLEGLGPWGPLAFIFGYAVATVAFVPGLVLTIAAGALFGLLRGAIYVLIGATLGSSAAFLIARYLARSAIERRLQGDTRFAAIDRAIGGQGLKIVLLLRLSPIFPFNLLNYGLGLTKVRFADYVLASFGMIPGTILYVYSGKLAGDVAAVASGTTVERGVGYYAVLGLGLVATIVVTTLITRVARRALKQATESDVGGGSQ